ncbi:MAG: hypothetical protein JRJ42_05595 [Deltaproteobacteria bacterium]|nr:hypothetical protein [Deltaproteobacteria bacterium]MBW2019614.1 hypothetical protein [Deltaproteobacteria bacterium]MBW2074429.1 hypothetical protein [Deltaproteobacteria bacterium]RLB82370.1 MAG: hypothetical protein DRH17_06065 [Deltaproteobacteria bacterium]
MIIPVERKISFVSSIISLILLFLLGKFLGLPIIQRLGFGVGFFLFSLFFILLMFSKRNLPDALGGVLFIALGFLGFSWLASIELLGDKNPIAMTFNLSIIKACLILYVIYAALYFVVFWIWFLVGSILGRGLVVDDSRWIKKFRIYTMSLGFSIFSVLLSFLYALLSSTENWVMKVEQFEMNFYLTPSILLWQIGTWLLILFLSIKMIDDEELAEHISTKGLSRFRSKKTIYIGFAILLATCTFFEAFRGLWWVWFGTAIWVTLMFASLWKIWKHVFDVPETKEKHMASSPP